jgi:DNA-binding NtrC family response regulator
MSAAGRILVVEDSEVERLALMKSLKSEGYTVLGSENVDQALSFVGQAIEVVLCDLNLGSASGLDLFKIWKKRSPHTPFIIITGKSSIAGAVEAIKSGAHDYIAKPILRDKMSLIVRRAIELNRMEKEVDGRHWRLEHIVGQSPQMKLVYSRIARAAPVDSTILILGENGTGKELVAHAIHQHSPRNKNPFVAINVAAVPATLVESELFGHVRGAFTGATENRIGRFEQADGGTLFIDEIGDFDLSLQPKLLRVLETMTVTPVGGQDDRKLNVRVVAATSRDLVQMVRDGQFREDLYYRLNVVQIDIPPLRQRTQDIPVLVEHFLKEIHDQGRAALHKVSPSVMQRLLAYHWPGNVRELHNTLESMMVLADTNELTEVDLPRHITEPRREPQMSPDVPPGLTIDQLEHLAITKALATSSGNRTHAAQHLGISVRTLQRKLRDYNTDIAEKIDDAGDIPTP